MIWLRDEIAYYFPLLLSLVASICTMVLAKAIHLLRNPSSMQAGSVAGVIASEEGSAAIKSTIRDAFFDEALPVGFFSFAIWAVTQNGPRELPVILLLGCSVAIFLVPLYKGYVKFLALAALLSLSLLTLAMTRLPASQQQGAVPAISTTQPPSR